MNRREKKKLRVKYLQKINNAIELNSNRTVKDSEKSFYGKAIDKDKYKTHVTLLEKLKFCVEVCDFRKFYDLQTKRKWPSNINLSSYWGDNYTLERALNELLEDTQLAREVTFKSLGI